MSLQVENHKDPKTLREFGLVTGLIFILLFGLFFPWVFGHSLPRWPWVIAVALGLPALIYPKSLSPVYWVWMKFALALGWVNTRILLSLVFFLIVTPFGFVMRLFGKDPLGEKRGSQLGSYRIKSRLEVPKRMEDPF